MASQSLRLDGMLDLPPGMPAQRPIGDGAVVLHGFAVERADDLLRAMADISRRAPLRKMMTPGGHTMSVAMTNCGELGWVTDRRGYRYQREDPLSQQPWPAMPEIFLALAVRAAAAAGFDNFLPDACLINRYAPGARMSLPQDKKE